MRIIEEEALAFMLSRNVRPTSPFPGGAKPWVGICLKCNEQISPRYANVLNGHSPCKFCTGKALRPGEPEKICGERFLKPLEVYPGNLKSPWKCECLVCGDIVFPRLGDLKRGQGGCLSCSYKTRAENQKLDPNVAFKSMVDAGAIPLEDYPGSVETPWLARCLTCGETVTPRLHSIRSGQGPCASCGLKIAGAKIKNSSVEAVATMVEAHLKPIADYPGAGVAWPCVCVDCGRESSPTLANVQNGTRCRFCSAKLAGMRLRLSEAQAIEDMEMAGLHPIDPYPGTANPWKVECKKCGKVSHPRHAGILEGKGCRFCGRDRVSEIQRLPQTKAFEIARAAKLEPLEPYSSISTPWKCRCLQCGNLVTPSVSALKAGSGGCIYCSRANIERTPGSILYLIQHTDWMAYKIGVGNLNRLESHKKKGWKIVKTWQADTVQNAYKSERLVLVHVREELGLPQYMDKSLMPQGGFTETFSGADLSVLKAAELVDKLAVGVRVIGS
jgi:hypothetical protein